MTQGFDDIKGKVAGLIAEAYERGRIAGRSEAEAALKERLASLFTADTVGVKNVSPDTVSAPVPNVTSDGRLAPGTVKPRVHSVIMEHPQGIRIEDIETLTGFKSNSIRGTLYALKEDGYAEKRGLYWFPIESEKPSGEEAEEAPPEGLNHEQDREAGPGGGT